MEFRVGRISAKCPKCGATRFTIPPEEHCGPYMNYQCADCGQATQYTRLVMQIGREVMAQRSARLSGERADRLRGGIS